MAKQSPSSPRPSAASSIPAGANDRLDLLQTFVRIVDTGSLSAAARSLGLAQPSVSRRLQQLERVFGRRLLDRTTHSLLPTAEGTRCYERAKEVLAGWADFEADFHAADREPEGLLRVVAPHAFGQQFLVALVAEYMRQYPRVDVEWLLQDREPDFVADAVDCAIVVGEARDPATVAVRLAQVPRIVVAAPAVVAGGPLPRHPRELARLPWLAFMTFYQRELVLRSRSGGEAVRVPLRPRFSTDNLFALRSAALQGLGVCVASAWVVAGDLARGTLVQLAPEWEAAALPIHAVYPNARFQPPKLRRFVELLRRQLPAALGNTVER